MPVSTNKKIVFLNFYRLVCCWLVRMPVNVKQPSEILGKHRQKNKPWITAEILDLYNKREREKKEKLRKNRFEPEGSEKYKEVNNNIKRCMKKAKENWAGE